jgi:N-acetylmuramoyl-L-alanine amidase
MTHKTRSCSATVRPVLRLLAAAALAFCLAPSLFAQSSKKTAAHAQYSRAEKMRASVEGLPQKDRKLEDYQHLVEAYKKVFLISPQAPEVTPSLMTEAELYQDMGRQFDPQYFQTSIDEYKFLLKEYPGSRHCSEALFTIAKIQQEDLNQLDAAEGTYRQFLQRFPHSQKVDAAQQALKEIADARMKESTAASRQTLDEQRESDRKLPRVTSIRHWNAENYTRIVIDLEDAVQYQSARIAEPDRIYFDLYKAKLGPALAGKTFDVQNGFLKAIRVAQNQKGTVRVVLDVDKVKEYSAFLLPNPYRLVIDVHGEAPLTVAKNRGTHPKAAAAAVPATEEKHAPLAGDSTTELASATKPSELPPVMGPARPPDSVTTQPAMPSPPARNEVVGPMLPSTEAKPTRDGQHSLTRALGLKISRIVIDPGHGGHDTGTVGPHGLMEKDLCLDVALRLGKLIQQRIPGAEVVFTRKDDTFVPLEERTAIANQERADLFLSIHANSSPDHSARGIETYYLNFATSADAMEVAARENALSQSSIHELQDLIKKIAANEKVEESKELASDIQDSLAKRLRQASTAEKNRGVKKAPFVVLIGANMPSVLSEISFISNPSDERMLKKPDQRQRVAEGLFYGVESYLESLNSLSYKQKLISAKQ